MAFILRIPCPIVFGDAIYCNYLMRSGEINHDMEEQVPPKFSISKKKLPLDCVTGPAGPATTRYMVRDC
jgi:hypothetical protein